ncbi:MAG: ABC transporter substrate-binding protein [Spirochaetes bacterium]|nr:ABC transporter substrate-binding protein [Spirochaetota bacterium]
MKKSLRVKSALGAVLVSIALVFSGCGGGQIARTDTLIVGVPAMHTNLDPILQNNIASMRIIYHVYDTLVYMDFDMTPQPNLATSWEWVNPESPDQLRVFLRQGVLFHNGDPLTAGDVAFSLMRASQSPTIAAVAGMIQSVDIVSDSEILINLDFPFVPFISFLGHQGMSIVSERAVTEMGQDAHSQAPIGTGPFRLTNIVAGDRVELTRWDQYWGEPALVENLVIRLLADTATRLIALETGEIDIMLTVPANDLSVVQGHPDLTLHSASTVATTYIAFNTSRPPFNDVRVRHAMQYAVDTEALVQAVFMGGQPQATGPINSMVWASAADRLDPFPFNPARARELLAEAGYSDGFSVVFFVSQGAATGLDTAEIMQNMLRDVGIDMSVQVLEWGAFLEASNRGEPNLVTLAWVPTTGDPDQGLFGPFHSTSSGVGNHAHFNNPQVDALLEAGRLETDPVLRAEIYYQLQRVIRDEAPWIFLAQGMEHTGVRNNVQGFTTAPSTIHRFWGVSLN